MEVEMDRDAVRLWQVMPGHLYLMRPAHHSGGWIIQKASVTSVILISMGTS